MQFSFNNAFKPGAGQVISENRKSLSSNTRGSDDVLKTIRAVRFSGMVLDNLPMSELTCTVILKIFVSD